MQLMPLTRGLAEAAASASAICKYCRFCYFVLDDGFWNTETGDVCVNENGNKDERYLRNKHHSILYTNFPFIRSSLPDSVDWRSF